MSFRTKVWPFPLWRTHFSLSIAKSPVFPSTDPTHQYCHHTWSHRVESLSLVLFAPNEKCLRRILTEAFHCSRWCKAVRTCYGQRIQIQRYQWGQHILCHCSLLVEQFSSRWCNARAKGKHGSKSHWQRTQLLRQCHRYLYRAPPT
jgi:hypothetical protein